MRQEKSKTNQTISGSQTLDQLLSNRLDCRSDFHKTELTLFADYSKPPQVDGVPLNYNPPKAYDSPFIQGDFGSGVVTIRKGEQKLLLDFTKE